MGWCMMKKSRVLAVIFLIACMFSAGCVIQTDKNKKIRDLEFTVVKDSDLPEELNALIMEKRNKSFKLTFTTNDYLYIAAGYGEQATGGYSICINELYLTDNSIHINTNLLGPGVEETKNQKKSYPYIVVKVEKMDKTVVFD